MEQGERTVLTLKNDVIFKAVYGNDTEESKFVLMALLNHILAQREDPIVSLEYLNPFQLRQWPDEKESILDIKVKTETGELIDIEMQICAYEYLENRLLYYHGGLIRSALKKGQSYGKMLKTITICIVDDIMFPETGEFLNHFQLMEEERHIPFSNMTGICVIELPKVNREGKPIEELTELELCLEYLKYADEQGSEYLDALVKGGGKELKMTQYILEKATEDELLRERALAREKFLHDIASQQYYVKESKKKLSEMNEKLDHASKELKEKKRQLTQQEELLTEREEQLTEKNMQLKEQNRQIEEMASQLSVKYREGCKEGKYDIAKALKADGMPAEKIMEYTGLTGEELQKL